MATKPTLKKPLPALPLKNKLLPAVTKPMPAMGRPAMLPVVPKAVPMRPGAVGTTGMPRPGFSVNSSDFSTGVLPGGVRTPGMGRPASAIPSTSLTNKGGVDQGMGIGIPSQPGAFPKSFNVAPATPGQGRGGLGANLLGQMPAPNSMAQYQAEKAAGGALTDVPYEQWKQY